MIPIRPTLFATSKLSLLKPGRLEPNQSEPAEPSWRS